MCFEFSVVTYFKIRDRQISKIEYLNIFIDTERDTDENSRYNSMVKTQEFRADEEQEANQSKEEDNVDFGSSGTVEDTAIKIIRVFANVSINPEAGSCLALCESIVDTLLDICKLPLQTSYLASNRSKYDNFLSEP